MREDVKDLLDRAAGWYSPPPIRAEEVRARGERRRRPGRVVAAAVALTRIRRGRGAYLDGLSSPTNRRGRGTGDPRRERNRPWRVGDLPGGLDPGRPVAVGSHDRLVAGSNRDLHQRARGDERARRPAATTALERRSRPSVGVRGGDNNRRGLGGQIGSAVYRDVQHGTARWSGALTQDDGPCGPGWYAYRHSTENNGDGTMGERPYLVFARFGPDASAEDRRIVFDAYDSLSFAPADILHPPVGESPWYVTPATIRVSEGPGTRCIQATTSGDFDGDGTMDHAEFVEVVSVGISCERPGQVFQNLASQELVIGFGSGQTVELPFTDCQGGLCAYVFEAVDLDGDGRDELAIDVSSGGATGLEEFYRVDPDTIQPLVIADPGDPPHVEPGPAILGGGFDSVLQSPVVCRVRDDAIRELVSIHAENVSDSLSGPWQVHKTTLVLRGDRLVVTSTEDSESSFPGTSGIPSFAETVPLETECS